ncbi:MAG: HAD family hydrolase [Actinobacteria bacterium]|nr:HAD family hydrolase [Actinomycetota bacterium]
MLEAVTFDYWETLVHEPLGTMRAMQVDRFEAELAGAGITVARPALEDAFSASWKVFEARWAENRGPYTHVHATEFVAERLGIPPLDGLRDRLVEAFTEVGDRAPLDLAPGIGECLDRLRGAGLRLAIVCDVGMTGGSTLRGRLERFGIMQLFDSWSFSDETGWFKPAREAFLPALEQLGLSDPTRAAHVGDTKRTDVEGARQLGMTAVRYTGFRDDRGDGPEGDHVIADHSDLAAVLGIG